jgi:hypothetical protein
VDPVAQYYTSSVLRAAAQCTVSRPPFLISHSSSDGHRTRRQPVRRHLVCTDSLIALQCLSGYSSDYPIVAEVLLQVSNQRTSRESVVFGRVPEHCGLPGNEAADVAAMKGPLVSDRALGTNIFSCVFRAVLSSWQAEWDIALGNKLLVVKPSVQEWQGSFKTVLGEEVTLMCLRIVHTPDTRTLVTRAAGARLHTLWCPSYRGTYLGALLWLHGSPPYLST